jgi:hypothetical protein
MSIETIILDVLIAFVTLYMYLIFILLLSSNVNFLNPKQIKEIIDERKNKASSQ